MERPVVPLALLVALLLSGCTAPSDDGLDAPGNVSGDAVRTHSDFVQRASLSWIAPLGGTCVDPATTPDAGPDVTYGRVQVDPATHGKPFRVVFDVQSDVDEGVSVQVTYYDADGAFLDGAARVLFLGYDPVVEGTVPSGAVEAHATSCAATAVTAEYAAGAIED